MENNKTMLIVDDDIDLADSTKLLLESKGFKVYTAHSEKEALKITDTNNFDIIFLDMIMEKIDSGLTICKEIRKKDDKVKIYLLSNVGEDSKNNIDIFEYGFNGVIQKPIKMNILNNII